MPGVDADELAAAVDQRAARIARVDRRVGLDEVFVVGEADVGAAGRADDARGDGLAQLERAANRQHPLADFQLATNRPRARTGALRDVDLQQRDVGGGIGADHRAADLALVRQRDRDLADVLADDVVVRDDVAVWRRSSTPEPRLSERRSRDPNPSSSPKK